MALNCIVDESALLAGLKDQTQDNLEQWIRDGVVNVFVPLYTLERLNALRDLGRASKKESQSALHALKWLDHITSLKGCPDRVQLQESDHQYQTWQEVEKYLLPDTPLSSYLDHDDGLIDDFEEFLTLEENDSNAISNVHSAGERNSGLPSLPHSRSSSLGNPVEVAHQPGRKGFKKTQELSDNCEGLNVSHHANSASVSAKATPDRVRPLLNYVVWRTHNNGNAVGNSGRSILLTNDATIQKQAQKFGVRAKMLAEVRSIVARDRKRWSNETSNTPAIASISKPLVNDTPITPKNAIDERDNEDDEDEVVFKPTERPSSSRSNMASNLWDPNHFGRSQDTPHGPRGGRTSARAVGGRNNRSSRGGAAAAARGAAPPRSPRGASAVLRGTPVSPRRAMNTGRAQVATSTPRQVKSQPMGKPIDPDSYARPRAGAGRGAFKRLWEPV